MRHFALILVLCSGLPGVPLALGAEATTPLSLSSLNTSRFELVADSGTSKPMDDRRVTKPKNIFYLGDSYLDDGNYMALSHATGQAYASPWSTVANLALGLRSVGRWTAAGNQPPLGNNYAIAGAGINYSSLIPTNASLHDQIAKLLQDYPRGLPSNSLVVIGIGTNDVRAVLGFGGVWSTSSSRWALKSEGFSVPAVDTSVTVAVTNTVGMLAGSMNLVVFPSKLGPAIMALTEVDPKKGTVTLVNRSASPGTTISPDSSFEVCGTWFLNQELPILGADIQSVAADHGQIILVLLPPTDLLPEYNLKPNQVMAHETWKYLYEKLRALAAQDDRWIRVFDLKPIFQAVFSDPTRYGFKFSYPGWLGSGSANPDDYMFWDSDHPSGSMHRYIAQRFLEFLRAQGLIQGK